LLSEQPKAGKPISSYTCFALKDTAGLTFGLLHLGSIKNHYFNETVVDRLNALLPFFGSVLARSFQRRDLKERKAGLLTLFAKFLPEPIIQKLREEQRHSQNSVGRKARVVILFSDIRSFTAITERNGAEPVVQFLNRHFQAMVTKISAHGGMIDKFIGDAIVAVFDADADPSDACNRAVRAARDMLLELPKVDVSSVVLDQGRYGIGVGLHMGDAVAGSIGSREKTAYTVIGDVIEHAEELESETKHYHVGMLMSRAVAAALKDPELALIDLSENSETQSEDHVFTLVMSR
jgi:class 3 adenylate cyclase